MQGNLTAPILIKLTKTDADILNSLAEKSDCTPGQLARYFIRKAIHEKIKEAPELIGG
jgi:hypothetical protein